MRRTYKELTTIDNSIRKFLQNSTDKNTKINELYAHISQLDGQIIKTNKNIDKLFEQSQKNEKSISELLNKSNEELEKIKGIKSSSQELLKDIQNIYEIAAETGLSGEFDKRRSHLKLLLKKWENRIFWVTLFLFVFIVMVFVGQLWLYNWDLKDNTFNINFYIRFLIASPIVYYIYFCSMQYSQTRKLHDKYSFKTTLAMSIKHHIQLLTEHEKFDKDERINKILDFVIEGFQKIYTEPHSSDESKFSLKLLNMEMDIEKRIMDTISKTAGIKK